VTAATESSVADGRVLQVNISPGGVPKLPVERAWVGAVGLEGDGHHHASVHGGPHRAVALLGIEAIERVQADGHPIEPGSVGENLTTSGIELARLAVGTRLAIGDGLVLELAAPANPCDVIKGSFRAGKSGRISILTHPDDSRMYARVLSEGDVRPGDVIRVLPPAPDSLAETHQLLDLLEGVERDAWLAMWLAAAAAGYDIQILERGDVTAAASPDLPGSVFNRSFGMRLVPVLRPETEALFRAARTTGWHVAGLDDPTFAGEAAESPVGVHVATIDDVLHRFEQASPPGPELAIREVDPDDAADAGRWAELFIAGFEIDGALADAWRGFNPSLVRSRGYYQFIAAQGGRDVAASAMFLRRRVAWLGGGTVLPEARGRGIQRVLIEDRVRRGAAAGARRAMATADVDSRSAANLEALGLHRIWTRGLYRVEPDGS
jgi:MOSC domain-containing protein YiiM